MIATDMQEETRSGATRCNPTAAMLACEKPMNTQNTSISVVPTKPTLRGAGFECHTAFPANGLPYFDPIVLFDELGPVVYAPGKGIGAPDHPHRGFEAVTYVLDGGLEHQDSRGHRGLLQPGDAQWMTAGAGLIHSEMPPEAIMQNGGRMHVFQIWISLPKEQKLAAPRYQDYTSAELPVLSGPGTWARVIAGEAGGVRSPIDPIVPTTLVHVKLEPNATLALTVPAGWNAIVHTIAGDGRVAETEVSERHAALIANVPGRIDLTAGAAGFEAAVLAGRPLDEPVVIAGPFVMNTQEEIEAALREYKAGNFGEIARTN